jgi:hypothetical protein
MAAARDIFGVRFLKNTSIPFPDRYAGVRFEQAPPHQPPLEPGRRSGKRMTARDKALPTGG